jgi:cellulose synthase/poly-beta-1,6-N-acetylglucosamine synthase-like glycosyltransferase
MNLMETFLLIVAIVLLIPSLIILIQVVSAYLPKKYTSLVLAEDKVIAVLIPAHNESSGIVATLNSIQAQLRPQDRLLVVADNCSDDTAEVAKKNGAELIERQDSEKRGKGYALDFGLRHLSQSPPDAVVIVDADCLLEANALQQLAANALLRVRPVQALYLMYAKGADLKSKIAEFAWCVKNLVRPLGYANLGLPCQLMGTGMAFPWATISNADLANGNIVEDMKLGIDLALAGTPPIFYLQSKVTSYFPLASEVQSGQKTRWEHGHLAMLITEAPRLFVQGLYKRDINLIAMAFDLAVPPLALLVMLSLGYAGLTAAIFMLNGVGQSALQVTLLSVVFLTTAIVLAWCGWGKRIISFSALLSVPIYVILKVPHYLKFLFKRQKTWNKTERD